MKKIYYSIIFFAIPIFTSAQTGEFGGSFRGFVEGIIRVIKITIPVLASLILLAFLWNMVKFIKSNDSQKAIDEGKKNMIWGIIALFVLLSWYGIIVFAAKEIGLNVKQPTLPNAATDTSIKFDTSLDGQVKGQ